MRIFIFLAVLSLIALSVNAQNTPNTTLPSPINTSLILNETNNETVNETDPPEIENPEPIVHDCNISLSIDSNEELYQSGDRIKIYNRISDKTYPFIIEYWVEDLFGNILKKKILTNNARSKTYTPKIDESDRILILKNKLIFVDCINQAQNVTNQKYVYVINNNSDQRSLNSSIEIKKVYLKKGGTSFGDTMKITLNLYRGDTRKYAIKAWVQGKYKVSEVSTIHLKSKFTEYKMTVPIQLKSNCNRRYPGGTYTLTVEGLNQTVSIPITIAGKSKLCKTIKVEKEVIKEPEKRKPKFYFGLITPITIDETYNYSLVAENNDKKAHNISIETYLFRGSKKYSIIQKKKFQLSPQSQKRIAFSSSTNASSGKYKIMAKVRVDNQSTVRSTSKEVALLHTKTKTSEVATLQKSCQSPTLPSKKQPDLLTASIVYESKSRKLQDFIPYIFIVALVLANICSFFFLNR